MTDSKLNMSSQIAKLLADKKKKEFEKENEIYEKWYAKYGESLKTNIIDCLGNEEVFKIIFSDIGLNKYNYKFCIERLLDGETITYDILYMDKHPYGCVLRFFY